MMTRMDIPLFFGVIFLPLHQPEDDVFLRSPGPSIAYPQHPGLVGSGAPPEPSPAIGAEACRKT